MKHFLIFSLIFVFSSLLVFGQTADEEVARLQKHLGVSEQTKITPAPGASLPKSTQPLRVFIATGLDLTVHENFVRRIDKWNKSGDAKKYGSLELVSDISQAQVILARYTLTDQSRT